MPFSSSCFCLRHDEWKHGALDFDHLRQCTRKEAEILDFASKDPKNKNCKRKICISCRTRLEVEEKCSKLQVSLPSLFYHLMHMPPLCLECDKKFQNSSLENSLLGMIKIALKDILHVMNE